MSTYDVRVYALLPKENAGKTTYNPAGSACSKNYIIFIGNGTPAEDLASSILSGWSGTSTATVVVRFFKGTNDAFTVLDRAGAANVKLDARTTGGGGVSLAGGSYVKNTVNFTATLTQSADRRSFVVTLGSPDNASRVQTTPVTARDMTWTPKAGPTDLAGNALGSTAAYTETDADQDF